MDFNSAGMPTVNPLALALMQGAQPGVMNSAGVPSLGAQPGMQSGAPPMGAGPSSLSSGGPAPMSAPPALGNAGGPPIGTMNGGYQNMPMPSTSAGGGALGALQGRPFGFGSVPLGY
jgi:hypothetical protein